MCKRTQRRKNCPNIVGIAKAAGVLLKSIRPPRLRKKHVQTHSRVIIKHATVVGNVRRVYKSVHRQTSNWMKHLYASASQCASLNKYSLLNMSLNCKMILLV